MPPPGSIPFKPPKCEDNTVTKPKPKTASKAKKIDEAQQLPPVLSIPFTSFPAEIQQMIWGEAINGPSCHHFKLRKAKDASSPRRWVVHIHEKTKLHDASAYRQWKKLFQVRDRAFIAAFRYYNPDSQIQPIALHKSNRVPACRLSAAINVPKDLVILDFDRGSSQKSFTWFEHMDPYPRSAMGMRYIQMRLQHFRKVAIHYKHHHANASLDGPFACYCPPGAPGCFSFKACPHELACFLDCFKNLEAFYFVLERQLKAHHDFAAEFKSKVSKKGYKASRAVRTGGKIVTEEIDLARFFDTKTEFLEHPGPSMLRLLDMNSSTPFDVPRECLLAAMRIYKNKIGSEAFHKPLTERNQVEFGLLIPYELEPKKPAAKA